MAAHPTQAIPRQRRLFFWGCLHSLCLSLACASSDVGQPCPADIQSIGNARATGDPTLSDTAAVVVQGTYLPCQAALCVSSAGVGPYCSRKCNSDASCPVGFSCQVAQLLGPFAGQRFCLWKSCAQSSDCGDSSTFCCNSVDNGTGTQPNHLCSFAEGHVCG